MWMLCLLLRMACTYAWKMLFSVRVPALHSPTLRSTCTWLLVHCWVQSTEQ